MFAANTLQVPLFLVEAAIHGKIPAEDLVATCLVMLDPGADSKSLAGRSTVSEAAIERAKGFLSGDWGEKPPNPSTPPKQPAPQPAPQREDRERSVEAWGARLQQMIDERLARPAPLREDQVRDLHRMCEGRDDVARALIAIIEQREKRGQVVDKPIGFIFGILRKATSLDSIIHSAGQRQARPRTVVDATVARVQQRVNEKGGV